MNIRFLGHAALEIKIGNKILIVDPFISGNPKQNKINVDQIKADYILFFDFASAIKDALKSNKSFL